MYSVKKVMKVYIEVSGSMEHPKTFRVSIPDLQIFTEANTLRQAFVLTANKMKRVKAEDYEKLKGE